MTGICIVLSLIAVTTAVAAALLFAKSRYLNASLLKVQKSYDDLRIQYDSLTRRLADAERNHAAAHERSSSLERELENTRQLLSDNERNFARMSALTLEEQSRKFRESNESRIKEVLAPLSKDIDEFRKRIEDCYSSEARERFALRSAIGDLLNQTQSIGREARELANALRNDSKTQGDWGEMILERLLENSGLQPGREFVIQMTRNAAGDILRNDDGSAIRPDVVVFLPENRAIVIDSKVSLSAYTEWANADNEETRTSAGKRHTDSVRQHINELRDKRYQDYVGDKRLDFVMMFMPTEGAYLAAMSLDESLWQYAFDNHVLIVSPTHLVSVLRLTAQLWTSDRQTSNALKIAIEAGRIHDKVAAFIDDMNKISNSLTQAQTIWRNAMGKLSSGNGNILKKTDDLRRLGARTARRLNAEFDDNREEDQADGLPES